MGLLRKILGKYFILKVSYTGQEAFSMGLCVVGGEGERSDFEAAENVRLAVQSYLPPLIRASLRLTSGLRSVSSLRSVRKRSSSRSPRPIDAAASAPAEWEDVEIDGIKEPVKKSLLVVVVGGYGVISKEIAASPEIVAKVCEEGGHYLWSESDGVITFVRAQQLEKLFAELDSAGIHRLGTLLVAGGGSASGGAENGTASDAQTLRLSEDFITRTATFKKAVTPSESGSLVAMALFHGIKLPVLGIVLLALVANTMLSSGVRARYNVTSARLERLKESSEHDRELSQGRRQAMAEFSKGIGYRYAVLCDRIARAMPPRITLTQLAVQPLDKKIEEGRKPQIEERSIVVSGTSPDPQSISSYVSALQKQSFANKVKLTSIEQNRDNPSVGFTITIEI